MNGDELMNGFALWEEHKPRSAEDWITVAERFIAEGASTETSSPLFAALVLAVKQRDVRPESQQEGRGER